MQNSCGFSLCLNKFPIIKYLIGVSFFSQIVISAAKESYVNPGQVAAGMCYTCFSFIKYCIIKFRLSLMLKMYYAK